MVIRNKVFLAAGLAAILGGLGGTGCKREETSVRPPPHSAEAVLLRLHEQGQLFQDALAKGDFKYIHDYSYYFTGLTEALYSKLNDGQRQKLQTSIEQLYTLANELDHTSGRRHAEATQATMQRLQTTLRTLDTQFQATKAAN